MVFSCIVNDTLKIKLLQYESYSRFSDIFQISICRWYQSLNLFLVLKLSLVFVKDWRTWRPIIKLPIMRILISGIFLFFLGSIQAQEMTAAKLYEIIEQEADTVKTNGNQYQFLFNDAMLICIFDENANRMRIISPIVEREKLGEEELLNALVANFHSALDVKYALSDEIIWSVYTHPLKELSEPQVIDAIQQVYAAAITFGNSYSSTNLVFPGNSKKVEKPKPEKKLNKT